MGGATERWWRTLPGRVDGAVQADLLVGAMDELTGSEDDFSGLLSRLASSGLGGEVRSWLGLDSNRRVSRRTIQAAVGDVTLERIAARAGVDRRRAARGLAASLPALTNHLAPHGELLSGDALASALATALDDLRRNQGAP